MSEVAQLDGQLPTYEQLRNMKYLRYCSQEGTSPPSPFPPANNTDNPS